MPKQTAILRVAKRDVPVLDLLAERPRPIAAASTKLQRQYDRLMQKSWAVLLDGQVRLTVTGYQAHMSSKVQSLRFKSKAGT